MKFPKQFGWLMVLVVLCIVAARLASGAPSAVTQSPYEINSAGATLSALVNPDGTNATVFFNYGTTTGYGAVSATNSISVTNAAIETTVEISGLLSRVPYHYRAVMITGTNTTYGQDVVFTTANYTYNYDGTGLTACDPTRPQDYEPGSVLAVALRQFKQQVLGAFRQAHNLDGTLLPGIVTASNLAPGAVTISTLDTNLQDTIIATTNTVTGGVSSNLFALGSAWTTNQSVSAESTSRVVTNDFYTLNSSSYPKVKVDAGITYLARRANGSTTSTRTITWPTTIYIGSRVGWSQSVAVTIPADMSTNATSTIAVSFLSAISSNDAVRLVLGKPTSSDGTKLSQQTTVNTLTVTGYE